MDIEEININNQHFYNTTHHLWFGNSVTDFLEEYGIGYMIKQNLSQVFIKN